MIRTLMHLLGVIGAFFSIALGGTITGRVVAVADGDTITLLTPEKRQVKIRLAGIDAPESGQEYGQKSKAALAVMVAGQAVTVAEDGRDRYGRTIGWVRAGEVDANREMVRQGWAWHFTSHNKDPGIARLQVEAKQARRGLWAAPNPPMAPWDYRALKRGDTTVTKPPTEKPASAADKYWINSNGVRHNSGCRWFGKTKSGHYGTKDEGKGCELCGG
jgi:endonuclease YncB( thermonuclease family)